MVRGIRLNPKRCKNPHCPNHGIIPPNPGKGGTAYCSDGCREMYNAVYGKADQNARQSLSRHTRRQVVLAGATGLALHGFSALLEEPTRSARYERAEQELLRVRRSLVEIPGAYPEVVEEAKRVAHGVRLMIYSKEFKGEAAAYLLNTTEQTLLEAGEQGDIAQTFPVLSSRAANIKYFWRGQKKKNPIGYAKLLIVDTYLHYHYAELDANQLRPGEKKKHLREALNSINKAIDILEPEATRLSQNKEALYTLYLAVLLKFKLFAFPLKNQEEADKHLDRLTDLSQELDSPWVWLQTFSQTAGFIRMFEGDIEVAEAYIKAAEDHYRLMTVQSPILETTTLRAKIETLAEAGRDIDGIQKCVKDYADLVFKYPLLFTIKNVVDFGTRFRKFGLSDVTLPSYAYTCQTSVSTWTNIQELFPGT